MKRKVFTIVSKGRKHRYATFEAAQAVAGEVFTATGVVLGIEEEDA